MAIMEIQSLNENITNERSSMPYPNVRVLEPSDALALVLPALPKGDLAVICEINGIVRQLCSVKKSARVINTIRKLSKIIYSRAKDDERKIESIDDIMEVLM